MQVNIGDVSKMVERRPRWRGRETQREREMKGAGLGAIGGVPAFISKGAKPQRMTGNDWLEIVSEIGPIQ